MDENEQPKSHDRGADKPAAQPPKRDGLGELAENSSAAADSAWAIIASLGPRVVIILLVGYVMICAGVFVVAYAENRDFECWPGIKLGRRESAGKVADPDSLRTADDMIISEVFGRYPDGRLPSIRSLHAGDEANQFNARLFKEASRSIKIVTVHGGSWIQELDVLPSFKVALKRAEIELLLVDPNGAAMDALLASSTHGFERGHGDARLSRETFRERFDVYRRLAGDSTYSNNLRLRYYSAYPWIRFSIFDNAQATFILVPFLKPGKESRVFYTDDPWIIGCLKRAFDRFQASSRGIDSAEDYNRLWTSAEIPPDPMSGTSP